MYNLMEQIRCHEFTFNHQHSSQNGHMTTMQCLMGKLYKAMKNGYSFMGGNCQNSFCLPSEKGSTSKGKNIEARHTCQCAPFSVSSVNIEKQKYMPVFWVKKFIFNIMSHNVRKYNSA